MNIPVLVREDFYEYSGFSFLGEDFLYEKNNSTYR